MPFEAVYTLPGEGALSRVGGSLTFSRFLQQPPPDFHHTTLPLPLAWPILYPKSIVLVSLIDSPISSRSLPPLPPFAAMSPIVLEIPELREPRPILTGAGSWPSWDEYIRRALNDLDPES
jgi:hypothetical protein